MKNTEFLAILEKKDKTAILPFLKSLSKEERRKLIPDINNEDKKYETWESRQKPGVWDIVHMLRAARFVCCTTGEAKNYSPWDFPNIEIIEEILEWYQPEWFSDFVNNVEVFQGLDYKRLVYWQHRGWINPTPETIVRRLPEAITELVVSKDVRDRLYTTEALELYPVTLDEHIWHVFYYPSNIEWSDVAHTKTFGGRSSCWCTTFKKYTDEGRLDRMRVLRESLLAVNRNFNKILTGWFATLFVSLEPTPDELFELQEELFATLTCVQTKPINTTLTLFKNMAKDKRFSVADFITHLPALLSAEVKAIVTTTLTIVETLLKQKAGEPEELCNAVCTAFLSKDEAVQKKAATIIAKYAKPGGNVSDTLNSFSDNILMSVKPLLQSYLIEIKNTEGNFQDIDAYEDFPSGFLPLIQESNRISTPESFEDFAFSLSYLLDVKEAHHFDLLLNNIAVWGGRTAEEHLVLLDPVFQKVFKFIIKGGGTVMSDMPLLIVINYYEYLQKKFPGKLGNIAKIKQKAEDTDKQRDKDSKYYKKRAFTFIFHKFYKPPIMTAYIILLFFLHSNLHTFTTHRHC